MWHDAAGGVGLEPDGAIKSLRDSVQLLAKVVGPRW